MEVVEHEFRLLTVEVVSVKRRRVDLGPEPAAFSFLSRGFDVP
jgi:hypothetical protein